MASCALKFKNPTGYTGRVSFLAPTESGRLLIHRQYDTITMPRFLNNDVLFPVHDPYYPRHWPAFLHKSPNYMIGPRYEDSGWLAPWGSSSLPYPNYAQPGDEYEDHSFPQPAAGVILMSDPLIDMHSHRHLILPSMGGAAQHDQATMMMNI